MKLFHYLLLAAGITLAAQTIKALPILTPEEETQLNCTEEEVTFRNEQDDITLCGSLIRPKTDHPVPVVLIIPGTGTFHRTFLAEAGQSFNLYDDLAKDLVSKGIATLLIDKRGCGKSSGNKAFQETTLQESIRDSLAGIEYLTSHNKIDSKKIGLIGHSEGGLLAPEIIQRSHKISFSVLLAPCTTDCISSHLEQRHTMLMKQSYDIDVINQQLTSLQSILSIIKETPDNDDAFTKFSSTLPAEILTLPEEAKQPILQAIKNEFHKWTTPHCRLSLSYDPQIFLKQIKNPVLAVFAKGDPNISTPIHKLALEQTLNPEHCSYTIKTLSGLSQAGSNAHIFGAKKLPDQEESTIQITDLQTSPELLSTVSTWIIEKTV